MSTRTQLKLIVILLPICVVLQWLFLDLATKALAK